MYEKGGEKECDLLPAEPFLRSRSALPDFGPSSPSSPPDIESFLAAASGRGQATKGVAAERRKES